MSLHREQRIHLSAQQEVIDIHAQLIIAFGGSEGLRDEGTLESALAAPEQRAYYEEADLAICAATYAYHLTQAHAFVDGNKRIAAAVTEIFVELNGAKLQATDEGLHTALRRGMRLLTTIREYAIQLN